ncbi:hypothetical protein [Roseibium aggregatum]|jgi:hypothetical protein|uniref:hypothetical protein n=1 Tax=Roseibium aggregatum TaxID=187304 RepID=UPI001E3C9680|nr:hypothetical protein [Roseibium aggregatum]UES46827.1 hypothetical protein GFK90_25325 [Roseibium aggregatum]
MAKNNLPEGAYSGRPIDWRNSAYLPLTRASEIAGVSTASLYNFESAGRLQFKRLAGRTLVTTESLIALIDSAEDWTPSDRGSHGRAARTQRARAAWEG